MDEKQISELLECSVCLERFDQNCRVLPCQHTFCRRCLDEIVLTKHELRCPECRAIVTQKVSDLPTNIWVIRILEGLKGYKSDPPDEGVRLIASHNNKPGLSPVRQPGLSPHRTRNDARGLQSSQPFRQGQSFAKALYDYESAEKEDLNFKRGDIIQLRRQIDDNWYQGELSGKLGCFPANFVKVIIPLPQVPQCKGLFDFDLKDENEKDCLTFQKDEIITVIRRVDENWLEGRKGDKIGIFPLTFVELNDAARDLISKATNLITSASVSLPPPILTTSSNLCTTVVTVSTGSSLSTSGTLTATTTSPSSVPGPSVSPEIVAAANPETSAILMIPSLPSSSSSSGQSSSTVVPISSTLVAADTIMVTSSPNPTEPVMGDALDPQNKRHSYSSSPSRFSPLPSSPASQQRHSMEVNLSVDIAASSNTTSANDTATEPGISSTLPLVSASSERQNPSFSSPQISSTAKSQEEDEDTVSSNLGGHNDNAQPATVANPIYVAMYNYLPQKDDELELRKGEHYVVVEKCQDGWFKGSCIKTGESGVFPGNYVSIMRHSSAFKPVNPNVLNIRAKAPSASTMAPLSSNSSPHPQTLSGNPSVTSSQNQGAPPLLPRVPKHTSGQKSRQFSTPTMRSLSNPATSRPVVFKHSVSEVSSSHSPRIPSSSGSAPLHITSNSPPFRPAWTSPPSTMLHQPLTSRAPSLSSSCSSTNAGMAISHDSAQTLFGKEKDKKKKKEKGKSSFLKLLKDKKSSKQSTTDSDVNQFTPVVHSSEITHIRCGSCPTEGSGSTITGVDNNAFVHHWKASSLDSTPPPVPAKPRPRILPRERYCCIAPYPPQTDYELCLELGDIIHVHRKREDGWFKGTQERTGKTGMFPASFVERCT